MEELSQHIMDIIENSVCAGSTLIYIELEIDDIKDIVRFLIKDDGKGIDKELLEEIQSPFFTTRVKHGKNVGLGIPLFKMNALICDGKFNIDSEIGKGTIIEATFKKSHIDRQPVGNFKDTIITSIIGHTEINFEFKVINNKKVFELKTSEIKKELQDIPINYPEVINFINDYIEEGFSKIGINTDFIN